MDHILILYYNTFRFSFQVAVIAFFDLFCISQKKIQRSRGLSRRKELKKIFEKFVNRIAFFEKYDILYVETIFIAIKEDLP